MHNFKLPALKNSINITYIHNYMHLSLHSTCRLQIAVVKY